MEGMELIKGVSGRENVIYTHNFFFSPHLDPPPPSIKGNLVTWAPKRGENLRKSHHRQSLEHYYTIYLLDLASRSFFSYPALQAFELRCVAKFFSPAGPTCMSVPQSGHSNVLSELNSFVIVLSPFHQFHALSERSNITSFSLAFCTSKLSTQWWFG